MFQLMGQSCNKPWVPHISLVFCEMWDSTNLTFWLRDANIGDPAAVVSHISQKTSEIWGTQDLLQVKILY